MNKIKKQGKKPSLFIAQAVKWVNLKDSQLSVRINNVFLYLPTLYVENIAMKP